MTLKSLKHQLKIPTAASQYRNVVFSVQQTDKPLPFHFISTYFQTSGFDILPSRLSSFQSLILQNPSNMSSPAKGQGNGESYSWRVTKEKNLLNTAQIERLAGLALLCINTMNVSVLWTG